MIKIFKEGKFSDILNPDLSNEDLIEIQKKNLLERSIFGTYSFNEDGSIDVEGDVEFQDSNLKKFPFKFNKVSKNFDCSGNQLTSLEGCPEEVGKNFYCTRNNLTNLIGAPKKVGENLYCRNNQLTSLEGAPKIINGNFSCRVNQLTSLEGCPEKVGGFFWCETNKKKFTKEDIKAVCDVGGEIRV